jgi:hypothetical protein
MEGVGEESWDKQSGVVTDGFIGNLEIVRLEIRSLEHYAGGKSGKSFMACLVEMPGLVVVCVLGGRKLPAQIWCYIEHQFGCNKVNADFLQI